MIWESVDLKFGNLIYFILLSSHFSSCLWLLTTLSLSRYLKITMGKGDKGIKLYDPGYLNTAPVRSTICYIDGDEGVLRYRGYPIEELAENSTFLEVAYLLSESSVSYNLLLGNLYF